MRTLTRLVVVVMATAFFVVPAAAAPPKVDVQLVVDIRPGSGSDPRDLTRVGGLVFFSAADGVHGRELWVTDGSEAGTHMVRDIDPGTAGSSPTLLTRVGSRLFFVARDGRHGRELWVSDGTKAGTRLVKDLTKGAKGTRVTGIADGAGTAYFGRDDRALWRTDGTGNGTQLVRGFTGVDVANARWMGSHLFLSADDALWKTNGSTKGTVRLSPAFWGLDGIARFRERIYFRATPPLGAFGGLPQLWWSDGTKTGTKRLGTMLNPTDMTVKDGILYFDAQRSASTSPRLYRGDGTAKGTGPVSPRVRPLWGLANRAGRLWAVDSPPGSGWWEDSGPAELWVSDGTALGTKQLLSGNGEWFIHDWDGPSQVGIDGQLYFVASPSGVVGDEREATDAELWSSDGTPAGTVQVADIHATGSAVPRDFVKLGRIVYFSADDGIHGRELWSLEAS